MMGSKADHLNRAGQEYLEAPGTAPGSTTFIPRAVYRRSWRTSNAYIGNTAEI